MEDHGMLRHCFATRMSMKPGKPSLMGKSEMIKVFLALLTFLWQNEAVTLSSLKIQPLKLVIKRQNNEGICGFIDVLVAAKCIQFNGLKHSLF